MVVHHVPTILTKFFPQFIWHKNRSEKKIYLTFDDGPVKSTTDFVLQALEKRNMNATFFMVGDNIRKNINLALEVKELGHRIGNHTYHHLNGFQTDTKAYLDDIQECERVMEVELGIVPELFRPPYGRIRNKQFNEVRKSYEVVLWDVLSGDFDPGQSSEKCLEKTIRYSQNGSIVVFHDQIKSEGVLRKVLDPFLDFLIEEGYQTELL